MDFQDKARGCLIGCAAGDALGYAVEFTSAAGIFAHYGADGITAYELTNGRALISDDTQMTLFTAVGLLNAAARNDRKAAVYHIAMCYRDWLTTQQRSFADRPQKPRFSWLYNVPALYKTRAPGNTCMGAIRLFKNGILGATDEPINNSKGCGGVMRVAPVGLFFDETAEPLQAARVAAEAAALTHGHEMGYIPAAVLGHIVSLCAHTDCPLSEAVRQALDTVSRLFPDSAAMPKFLALMNRAVELSSLAHDDLDDIKSLGEGWVGDEALAIAVYCALKYPNDIERALIASVNHSGDSDSTGAIAGSILGAYLGLSAFPKSLTTNLELYDLMIDIADDLAHAASVPADDPIWRAKYIDMTYGDAAE